MAISPLFSHSSPSITTALTSSELQQSLNDHSIQLKTPAQREALYKSLISLCITNKSLSDANRLRSHLTRTGFEPSLFLQNQFINLYSKCRDLSSAREVFSTMPQRNIVTWNAMLTGYSSNSHFIDAISLFRDMIESGPQPDLPTYLTALRAAGGSRNPHHGQQIHTLIVKNCLHCETKLANALITMYWKTDKAEEAEAIFKRMPDRDAVSWNSIIAVNSTTPRALALFRAMQEDGLAPDEFTFTTLLRTEEADIIEMLHSLIVKNGLTASVFTATALSGAYARCSDIQSSLSVFKAMPERTIVAWNSAVTACFDNDAPSEGVRLFLQMTESGIIPDEYSISILLKAATSQLSDTLGKQLHGLAVKIGAQSDTLTGNSLITMYGEHGSAGDSWRAFRDIADPDIISWNSLVRSHVINERFERAVEIYVESKLSGFQPDEFSFTGAMAACASLAWLATGRGLHCEIIKTGIVSDKFVGCKLVDMYAKSMATEDAKMAFDQIERKDLIAWNSIIASYAQNGDLRGVLKHLHMMREENHKPDNFTYASVVAATADATAVQLGRQVHALIVKSELDPDTAVGNALLTMYTKVGSLEEAERVFSEIKDRNVVSWTAMIGGYAQGGYSKEAIELFDEMENIAKPNSKTFIALLTACSYAGLQNKAAKYFEMMKTQYGIKPEFEHYACMVDILGRAGKLSEAETFIEEMPCAPDALVWRMLLSACRIHGDFARGKRAMENILALEPGDSAAYVLASNLNAAEGNWKGVEEVRQLMRKNGVKKERAKSWIEIHNTVHEFMAGDCSHPQKDEILSRLRELSKQMRTWTG